MALNWEVISNNIINISQVLADFLDTKNPKKVEWVYMKEDGEVSTVEVDNLGAVIKTLQDSAITPDELADELKNYYSKTEVDAIKQAILKVIDDNKTEIVNKINGVETELKNEINTTNTNLNNEIAQRQKDVEALNGRADVLEKRTVMTEAEYQALAEARRKMYAGSGFVNFGKTYCDYNGWGDNVNKGLGILPVSSSWSSSHFYMGNTKRFGAEGIPVINVNGNLIKLVNTGYVDLNNKNYINGDLLNNIYLPEPATVKSVVKDSTSLPVDLEQGDFIILKDLDRNLLNTLKDIRDVNNWENSGGVNISKDDNGNLVFERTSDADGRIDVIFRFSSIKDLKTSVTITDFSIVSNDENNKSAIIINQNGSDYFYVRDGDVVEDRSWTLHYSTTNSANIIIRLQNKDDKVSINPTKFIIKQVEEQPVIALQNVEQNIDIYQNSDKFEARDSVSRQDLVFLEVWDEDISEKDCVYPFGNIQYQGGNVEGLSGITAGTFEGADTYSLFGNWQKAGDLVGKGYVWSQLTEDQKIALASNPDHNIRKKGNTWLQTRYRIRVVKGLGNSIATSLNRDGDWWHYEYPECKYRINAKAMLTSGVDVGSCTNLFYSREGYLGLGVLGNTSSNFHSLAGKVFAVPIAIVQRRNDGVYNKLFNPEGTAQAYDKDNDKLLKFEEFALDNSFVKSLEDCFDVSKIAAKTTDGNIVPADDSSAVNRSGYIMSGMSGNEAELYADEINERDVEDLRMLAEKKPYKEILDEYLQKAITGNIRGKENIKNMDYIIVNQDVLYTSGSTASDNAVYSLYVARGTDDYVLKHNGEAIYGKEGDIVEIFDNEGNYVKLIYKDSHRLRRLTFPENQMSYGMPWQTGDLVKMTIIASISKTHTRNNIITQTDIIGDPRKLQDRVTLTVTDTDESVGLKHNTYVLCNDATNNNGTAGHYYRYLGSDLSSIHTNSTDGDANAEGGHIDFSDTAKWLDLGSDGTVGGYPDAWLENGFQGTPLLVSEEGDSMLPIDALDNPSSGSSANVKPYYYGPYHSAGFKLSRKGKNLKHVLVRAKNGEWVRYNFNSWNKDLSCEGGNSTDYIDSRNHLFINIGNDNTLEALGYSSVQEAADLMQIVVVYDACANFLDGANNNEVLELSNYVRLTKWAGETVVPGLINKVSISGANNSIANLLYSTDRNINGNKSLYGNNAYKLPVTVEKWALENTTNGPACKYFSYLTQTNNRAYLQFVFKEMKFSGGSWGDDNKFQITDKISTVIDLNGERVLIGQKRVALPYFITD